MTMMIFSFFSSTQAGLDNSDFSVATPYDPDSPPKEKSLNKLWEDPLASMLLRIHSFSAHYAAP